MSNSSKYKLQDLIDMKHFQRLQDQLNEIYSFPSAIIDNEGNVLTATAWQDICTKFHRMNPESEKHCRESDRYILSHLHEANPAVSYRCPHGLVDNATPIVIEGVHYGNFFTGQFFLEPPDLDFFRKQARTYGYDETAYLEAVKKVPIWTQEQLEHYLYFIKGLIAVISESGLKNLREIEARKTIEESEERASTVLQKMHEGFWIIDVKDGKICDANEAACRMLGYSREEMLQLRVADVEAVDSRERTQQRIDEVKKKGSLDFESQLRAKDDTLVDVAVSITYLSTRDRIFAFIRDVTLRKRMEEEVQRTLKLESLGVLAGGIAHDFNNLICSIMGYIELAHDSSEDDTVRRHLDKTLESIDRAQGMTQQLLTFAKGGQPIRKTDRLYPFLRETAEFALSGSNVTCQCQVPESLHLCCFDRHQIGQVVDNLVLNAQQAMPQGGTIELSASNVVIMGDEHTTLRPGEYVRVSVRDHGTGIPDEVRQRIFDPYFTTKERGHGLGLATCYSIINRHDGYIDVVSEQGRGSEFFFYLPAAVDEGPVSMTSEVPDHKGHGTIIVMEDEETLRGVLGDMLRSLGYSVELMRSGAEVLEYVNACSHSLETIAAMVFDLTIPGGMGGRETLQQLQGRIPTIPVFVVSGYADDPVVADPESYGFAASLRKPFRRRDLVAMLDAHLPSVTRTS